MSTHRTELHASAVHTVTTTAVFRVSGKRPELWDPLIGKIRDLPDYRVQHGRTAIALTFEPHQSYFIVFRESDDGTRQAGTNFLNRQVAHVLSGPWKVEFDPQWGGPAQAVFEELVDWPQRQRFSY